MIKKLKRILAQLFGKKEKRIIPKSVQQSIPIKRIYRDGIIQCGQYFSKTWRFSDINYAVASDDDQLEMFLAHSAILNGLPTDAFAKITVYNKQLNRNVFEQFITPTDHTDKNKVTYTKELKELLSDKMSDSNNIVHEKYITVSSEKKNIEEARTFFIVAPITANVSESGSFPYPSIDGE